jgi:hypothetical protein
MRSAPVWKQMWKQRLFTSTKLSSVKEYLLADYGANRANRCACNVVLKHIAALIPKSPRDLCAL